MPLFAAPKATSCSSSFLSCVNMTSPCDHSLLVLLSLLFNTFATKKKQDKCAKADYIFLRSVGHQGQLLGVRRYEDGQEFDIYPPHHLSARMQ